MAVSRVLKVGILSLGSGVGEMFCFTVNNNTIHQLKTNEPVSAGWD